jgi:Mannosyltransferase (PIG-V)
MKSEGEVEAKSRMRFRFSENARWILVSFAASRVVVALVMVLSRQIISRGPYVAISGQMEHGGTLFDLFTQSDGVWYRMIAEHGYQPPAHPLAPSFFPFYPILIRLVAFVVRDWQTASLLVSNGCFIAAVFVFDRLLRLDHDEATSRRAITFLMFSPLSFFFSSAYTESTFLLLAVGATFAARKEKWFLACLCAACLGATRPPGILIGVLLLAEYLMQWRNSGAKLRALLQPRLLSFTLIPLGLVAYLLYCHFALGDFFKPMHAHGAGWAQHLTWPWQTFLHPQNFTPAYVPLYRTLITAGLVTLVAGVIVGLRPSYWIYAMVSAAFSLSWANLDGVPRYFSVIFPLYIALAVATQRWKWSYEPILAFSVALLALCSILAANAYQMS